MKYKIFVDGGAGTTGLEIVARLKKRDDVSLITLSEENRKSDSARKEALNSADLVFLCLPDDAAIAAVSMIENPSVKVIDASTAHRTKGGWVYGFPEINGLEKEI
ncbi:MAG: N-acetyl-gamma-glutamyl-phosphate reductase, partial [Clostridia bacterium]|nr:N-acetyl-gamma-glutamyl-phosphate reductase [Clostridia bacterium]